MDEKKDGEKKVHKKSTGKGSFSKKEVFKFINDNFMGISILLSTIILSCALIVTFGGGSAIGIGGGGSPLQDPSSAPNQPGGSGAVGEQAIAPDLGDAPFLGNKRAKVTIVEYSDYECPFCARFYSETLGKIKSEYVDTGKVKFVYKDYPITSIHAQAQKAAEAARCVGEQLGNEGYFAMHDKIFEGQSVLSVSSLKQWSREVGANGSQFDSCLDSDKYGAAVQADLSEGSSLGVSGTPTFFINDKMVVGAVPFEQLVSVIESELESAN